MLADVGTSLNQHDRRKICQMARFGHCTNDVAIALVSVSPSPDLALVFPLCRARSLCSASHQVAVCRIALGLLLAAFAASGAVSLGFWIFGSQHDKCDSVSSRICQAYEKVLPHSDAYGRITGDRSAGVRFALALWNSSFDDRFSVERPDPERTDGVFLGRIVATLDSAEAWSLRAAERGRWPVSQHGWFTGLEGASLHSSEQTNQRSAASERAAEEAWPGHRERREDRRNIKVKADGREAGVLQQQLLETVHRISERSTAERPSSIAERHWSDIRRRSESTATC